MKNIIKYLLAFLMLFSVVQCDDITDLNVDPNNPTSARAQEVLTSAEGYIGFYMDSQFNQRDFLWAQYWAWGPGVSLGDIARYIFTPSDGNQAWARSYSNTLADLKFLKDEGGNAYSGIAKVLEAFTYNNLVDHFGDVPFTQAIDGNNGVITPTFDDDQAIYNGIITLLDEAIVELNSPGSTTVGAEDFIYHGDLNAWIKFANSLKLRLLMRQANISDVGDQVRSLVASSAFIESFDDIAKIDYTGNSGSENSMYAWQERGIGNFYKANNGSVNVLRSTNDPRLFAFYKEAVNFPGEIRGADQHEIALDFLATDDDWSSPADIVYGAAESTYLMTSWETWFLRAEAAARYGTSDSEVSTFENAISENFNFLGVTNPSGFTNSLGYDVSDDLDTRLDLIGVQKWVSMNGTQEAEGWITSRLFDRPESRIFSQQIFQTPEASALPPQVFPSIWLYPDSEVAANEANVPVRTNITDKVFWDN